MKKTLFNLIKSSESIMVTSHISPDPDAVASLLLMGSTLKLNFPDKKITMVLEEKPGDLNFIEDFDEINFRPVYEVILESKPDLLVILDGNSYERVSRQQGGQIRDYINAHGIKIAVIDHHEEAGKDDTDVFINNDSASTVQDVYGLCFQKFGLKAPKNSAQTAMVGFYADTGGFVYVKAGSQDKIFGFARELVAAGADIESVKNNLENYTESDMKVIAQLAANISHGQDYTYSFLDDEFINNWLASGNTQQQLQRPNNAFTNSFIRNIERRRWGFIVYKNTLQGDNYYSVSLRSQGGMPDVSQIAAQLGGGGHKPAAGAKFEAADIEEALMKVKRLADNLN